MLLSLTIFLTYHGVVSLANNKMSDNKGDKSKKQQKHSTPSPKDNTQETLGDITPSVTVAATVAAPTFLSPPPPQQPQSSSQLYLSTELVNPKRDQQVRR